MNAKKQPGQQLSFFDIPQMFYVGETEALVSQEIARMINVVKRTKSKGIKKSRKSLLKALRSYHPGLMFADNWAEGYDSAKTPVTVERVRDDILWELTYWQHITENQAMALRS